MPFHRVCLVETCRKEFVTKFRHQRCCSRKCGNQRETVTIPEDIRQYLLNHVNVSDDKNACWPWQGYINDKGYGVACIRKTRLSAHRVSYEVFIGPIPDGLHILHSQQCTTRACINPDHLRTGTNYENMQDRKNYGDQPRGTKHYATHLTEDDIRNIRRLRIEKELSYEQIGVLYNINPATINNIIYGFTWKHVDADTYQPPTGDSRRKITPEDVRTMRDLFDTGQVTITELVKRYNLSFSHVARLVRRETWRHIP